jgi:hypothetical protein
MLCAMACDATCRDVRWAWRDVAGGRGRLGARRDAAPAQGQEAQPACARPDGPAQAANEALTLVERGRGQAALESGRRRRPLAARTDARTPSLLEQPLVARRYHADDRISPSLAPPPPRSPALVPDSCFSLCQDRTRRCATTCRRCVRATRRSRALRRSRRRARRAGARRSSRAYLPRSLCPRCHGEDRIAPPLLPSHRWHRWHGARQRA